MDAERLERVKTVLEEAMDLPSSKRGDFVREACGGDEEVMAEVASLLACDEDEPLWPERPLVPPMAGAMETWPTGMSHSGNGGNGGPPDALKVGLDAGDRFGRYRVEESLGEGGMGAVALAVREDDFEKRVALKVVHVASADRVRRFEQERQMLARLEHPNVARLLDGGTAPDGRPWFAMEYVDGEPIDEYCDAHGLGVRERLDLVLRVCAALEMAHRNLVVHRDIKPSNILVTEEGVPKLLDFGIAKSLEPSDATELTRIAERPMTLRWASPEQLDGESITTATDVYGIGLLLYHLLAGVHPFAGERSDLSLIAAIRERDPQKPSALADAAERRKALRGDLDAIVCKALQKDPDRRYVAIGELAADLRRYLDGRPVEARPRSRWYVTRRFLRRHWLPISAAVLILVVSVTFGLVAGSLNLRAEAAKDEAEISELRAEKALYFMEEILSEADPEKAGKELRGFVEQAEKEVDREEDGVVQARALGMIGGIYAGWGDAERATNAWTRAVDILRREYPEESYPEGHKNLAMALNNLASGYFHRGDYGKAKSLYQEAISMKRGLNPEEVDIAQAFRNLASAKLRSGDLAGVESLYLQSIERLDIRSRYYDADLGKSWRGLAAFYLEVGEVRKSEDASRKALKSMYVASKEGETTRVASVRTGLARALHDQGRFEEALVEYQSALTTRRELLTDDHLHVTSSHLDLARVLIDLERFDEAADHLQTARAWLEKEPEHRHGQYRARAEVLAGVLRMRQGGLGAETERLLREGTEKLIGDRKHPDHYGRRALEWIEEFEKGPDGSVEILVSPKNQG